MHLKVKATDLTVTNAAPCAELLCTTLVLDTIACLGPPPVGVGGWRTSAMHRLVGHCRLASKDEES